MAEKVLNSFDVWIGAQGWKSKLRLRSVDNISIEGIVSLRQLILSLAMQGKLAPVNLKESGPTDQELISLKDRYYKIIKAKPKDYRFDPPLIDEFNLPNTWKWKRVGELCDLQTGATPSTQRKEYFDGNIRWLVSGDINQVIIDECEGRISEEGLKNSNCKILPVNTVLIALNGQGKTRASVALLKVPAACNQSLVGIIPFASEILDSKFLMLSLKLRYYEIRDITGQKQRRGLNMGLVANLSIPLPPLAQQHRIVAKVDELMALCDELEQQETSHLKSHQLLVETLLGTLTQAKDAAEFQTAWATLAQHFDDLFITEDSIDQLKQTILQLAVMGKLVPQDQKDEPAGVLLEKIGAEKERLINEGKIKRQTSPPVIDGKEISFGLPKGWKWCRLTEVCSQITDGEHQTPPRVERGKRLLSAKNVRDGYLDYDNCDYISEENYLKSIKRCNAEIGDLLIVSVGGTIGRVSLVKEDIPFALVRSVALIKPLRIASAYLKWVMNSPLLQDLINEKKRGGAQPCLYLGEINEFVFPLPPLSEQQRIVVKIEKLFALCDSLKERITESQKVANQMADSILEQVV